MPNATRNQKRNKGGGEIESLAFVDACRTLNFPAQVPRRNPIRVPHHDFVLVVLDELRRFPVRGCQVHKVLSREIDQGDRHAAVGAFFNGR